MKNKKILYIIATIIFGFFCVIGGTYISHALDFTDPNIENAGNKRSGVYNFLIDEDFLNRYGDILIDGTNTTCSGISLVKDNDSNTYLRIDSAYNEECDIYIDLQRRDYTGYYADTNDDGSIDGVIFFDYMYGADTTVGETFLMDYDNANPTVVVEPITEGLNTYELKTVEGHENVVVPTSTDKKDRFYVIDLETSLPTTPAVSNRAYWYYSDRRSEISDYATVTSTSFGSGKTNTSTMKTKWNSETYGAKNNSDMWTIDMGDKFVPSKDEWLVLGSNFKKLDPDAPYNPTTSKLDLEFPSGASLSFPYWYWSSSLADARHVWYALFTVRCMNQNDLFFYSEVRLAMTF